MNDERIFHVPPKLLIFLTCLIFGGALRPLLKPLPIWGLISSSVIITLIVFRVAKMVMNKDEWNQVRK